MSVPSQLCANSGLTHFVSCNAHLPGLAFLSDATSMPLGGRIQVLGPYKLNYRLKSSLLDDELGRRREHLAVDGPHGVGPVTNLAVSQS
jgi:hypothetical protein